MTVVRILLKNRWRLGAFPEEYLKLLLEILSTAMREGQKLFSVVKGKKQLPFFLGVADAPGNPMGFIQKGNERVLKARLEDAKFFWEQDLKISLAKRAPGLKHVLFQEKLGSYDDKVQRLKKIVAYLCEKVDAHKIVKEAALAALTRALALDPSFAVASRQNYFIP